jgi:lipopolysaccharide/colanic/teichoic acid biosynthesis glycosyltransferase
MHGRQERNSGIHGRSPAMLKRILAAFFVACFLMITVPVMSAEQWIVIKDSKGRCSVRTTSKGKTPKTIAGPFATKAEADKAKADKCGKTDQQKGK